ncbi:hypothetical protein ACIGHF_18320 [Stenotrophomonas sp. NPDC077464]|uniref:hypothetical protein n=1 Tax=unclassified Stenotrophomonas TaxID=196198 RepID=UPI0037CD9E1B
MTDHASRFRRFPSLAAAVLALPLLLPGPAAATPPRYIDLAERRAPGEPADDTVYQELNRLLVDEFTDARPDAFCAGPVDNYRPLRLDCVVDTRNDRIHACRFAVVASQTRVHPGNGAIRTELSQWYCPLPLPSDVPAATFLAHMTTLQPDSSGYLFNRLPGSALSVFDVLRRCLS